MATPSTLKPTWQERDRKVIWHPFTQAKTASDFIPIVKGEGAYLFTENGSSYLDGISSWWVNLHGHGHPYIASKIYEQASTLEHVSFGDFTHPKAIELAERLVALTPGGMTKVFYSDNGSTAVEIGIKIALQYWFNQNPGTINRNIICFKHGYHGDTFGAMSAAGRNIYNRPFWPFLFDVKTIEPPVKGKEEISYNQLKACLEEGDNACFIFEPLVQGAGGMKMHSPEGLDPLLQLCRSYGVLTIADEVMTGFGRTGPLFACDSLFNKPDIICLSKGLTGGFLPLAATLCREDVFEKFYDNDRSKAFLHGHSYTANGVACAAALASLDLLETGESETQRMLIEQAHQTFCQEWSGHPRLLRAEVSGTILALEYDSVEKSSYFNSLRDRLYHFFLSRKILLRPLGNVLYVLPPYCIKPQDLEMIYQSIAHTLESEEW